MNEAGWATGEIRDSQGNLLAQYLKVSSDDLKPSANAIIAEAADYTTDPKVWAIAAVKGYANYSGRVKGQGSANKGPSGRVSTEKYLENNWDKASFGNTKKSIDYHVTKHGKGMSEVQYTQRVAVRNFEDSAAIRSNTTDKLGRPAVQVTSKEGTGLYTKFGKIIWFHPN